MSMIEMSDLYGLGQVVTQAEVDAAKAEFSTLWSKYLDMTRNQSAYTQDQVVAAYQAALAAQTRANDLASRVGQAAPVTTATATTTATSMVSAPAPVVATGQPLSAEQQALVNEVLYSRWTNDPTQADARIQKINSAMSAVSASGLPDDQKRIMLIKLKVRLNRETQRRGQVVGGGGGWFGRGRRRRRRGGIFGRKWI